MKNAKPVIVSFLGWSNSGKTTFIETAIAECVSRGIVAAALKKSHNAAGLSPDSKDSSRFRKAGAEPSIYLSDFEMLILKKAPSQIDITTLVSLCPDASIIFCEGLEIKGAQRVLMTGDYTIEANLKRTLADIDILVTRDANYFNLSKNKTLKVFKPEDVNLFIDYLFCSGGFS